MTGTHNAQIRFGAQAVLSTLRSSDGDVYFGNNNNGASGKTSLGLFEVESDSGADSSTIAIGATVAYTTFDAAATIDFGGNSRIQAGIVDILAENNSAVNSYVVAGAGAIGAATGISKLTAIYNPTLTITFANNSAAFLAAGTRNIESGQLSIKTNAGGLFNGKVDAFTGALIGSGTDGRGEITVNLVSKVNLGNIQTLAPSTVIHALTDLRRDYNSNGIKTGCGAIVSGASGSYIINLSADTGVFLGDYAFMTTGLTQDAAEELLEIIAQNKIDSHDLYDLVSAGALAVAQITGSFNAPNLNADILVGQHARLLSGNQLNLGTRSLLTLDYHLSANGCGLVGFTAAKGTYTAGIRHKVSIGDNSTLWAGGEMHLGAGSTGNSNLNQIRLTPAAEAFAGALVNFQVAAEMKTTLNYDSTIYLGAGTDVQSVGNVELLGKTGFWDIQKIEVSGGTFSSSKDNGFHNIFTDSGIVQGSRSDSLPHLNLIGGVEINGTVKAGIHARTLFEVRADGSLNPDNSEWVRFNLLEDQALDQNFDEKIAQLQKTLDNFLKENPLKTNDAYPVALKAEIDRLKQEAAKFAGKVADVLTLDSVRVAAGDIVLAGNYVKSSANAQLYAYGNPSVNVIKNSSAFLQTGLLEIVEQGKGRILFNNQAMTNSADINKANAKGHETVAQFKTFVYGTSTTFNPTINVRNTAETSKAGVVPEYWIVGNINNPLGARTIDSEGSIRQAGNTKRKPVGRSGTQNITARPKHGPRTNGSIISSTLPSLSTSGLPDRRPRKT